MGFFMISRWESTWSWPASTGQLTGNANEREVKRRRAMSVGSSVADRLSSAIHYSPNASQCQLYYRKAVPDWRPQWGEKNGCKILLDVLGENKGEAVMDGCIWPMQGRRQRRSLPDETELLPLCPEQPSIVRRRGNSSSCFRQCFYHLCQNRCSTYSTDKSHVAGIQNSSQIIQTLWKDWC